jgi:type VI protein secretion system component Hcp
MFDPKSIRVALLSLFAVSSYAPLAHADHVFVQIPGILGESTDRGYEDWIDATGVGLDFNRRVCGALTLAKGLDRASSLLAVAAANGEILAQAVVAVRTGGDRPFESLRLTLTDVVVSSINIQSADPSRAVTESLQLVPRSVTMTYRPQRNDGSAGTPVTTIITCNRGRDRQ